MVIKMKDNKIEILYSNNPKYPEFFNKIKNKPKKLYIQGNIELLNKPCIAIVGSRKFSEYGKKMAKKFTKELVNEGFAIVSGLADGIDTFAHEECIASGGKTIAVIACGFNKICLEKNKELYHKILNSNGCIITEYSPNTLTCSKNFPVRNRLISGLSLGTLVVEANYRSGTSITARFCMEQNRKLFCIPNSLESKNSIGVNKLIKKGAILVTCIDDIIKEVGQVKNKIKIEKKLEDKKIIKEELIKIEKDLSKQEFKIYKLLKNNSLNVDEISNTCKLNISEVNVILSKLEIEDYILKLPNNKYSVRNNEK